MYSEQPYACQGPLAEPNNTYWQNTNRFALGPNRERPLPPAQAHTDIAQRGTMSHCLTHWLYLPYGLPKGGI